MLRNQLKHVASSTLLALVIFAAALLLAAVEKWCETSGYFPEWIPWGLRTVSMALFAIDGIVVCSIAAILGGSVIFSLFLQSFPPGPQPQAIALSDRGTQPRSNPLAAVPPTAKPDSSGNS